MLISFYDCLLMQKERRIMELLLKIKNGTPPMRKSALRRITDKAREFGAGPLFNQILPLLMSPTLEDQERHLLVKVIDRVLYKLDDLVRPYVHKILVVIEPLLIDEDYYARVEGREIISNLAGVSSAGVTSINGENTSTTNITLEKHIIMTTATFMTDFDNFRNFFKWSALFVILIQNPSLKINGFRKRVPDSSKITYLCF